MATAMTIPWWNWTAGTYAPEYFHQLDDTVRELCLENGVEPVTAPWYSAISGTYSSEWINQIDDRVRKLCAILSVDPPINKPSNFYFGVGRTG